MKIRKKEAVGVFSVIWIIITSGGVYLNSQAVVNYTLIADAFLVIIQFLTVGRSVIVRFGYDWMLFFFITSLVIMSVVANTDFGALLSYARLLLILALVMSTCMLVTQQVFFEVFTKTILVLAVISIVFFFSGFVEKNAGFFPIIKFYDFQYSNAFLYLDLIGFEGRNLGVFIEPGLYQIYLNVALFLVLTSHVKVLHKNLTIIILLISIFSTKSTTGFIVAVMILGGSLFTSNSKKNVVLSVAKNIFVISAVVIIVMSDFFRDNINDKFYNSRSSVARENSTLIDLFLISKNPLTGVGFGNYQKAMDTSRLETDSASNTFTQLGALLGMPFVLAILWRVILYIKRLELNLIEKITVFFMYLIFFSTEPFVLYPLFYLPVFMSVRHRSA